MALDRNNKNSPPKGENPGAFKNWLNRDAAAKIAKAIHRSWSGFSEELFLKNIERELSPLELKGRMLLLQGRLDELLPKDAKKSLPILIESLRQNDSDKVGLSGFLVWPLTHQVVVQGPQEFDLAMRALYRMTQVFTSEFAIRPFLQEQEERTLKVLRSWVEDDSEHVRRLVSEGSRPLLPWGQKLPNFVQAPEKTWPLLDALKLDPSDYVQTSVANHINDHSKNHPDDVVRRLSAWKKQTPDSESLEWIVRHASRTLVKKGHTGALKLHGVTPAKITMKAPKIHTPAIKLGQSLNVSVKLTNESKKTAVVILDHALDLLKANGKHQTKVFKGRKLSLKAGETVFVEQKIKLKKVTTRTYYSGPQSWTPVVNGVKGRSQRFQLKV